MSLYRNQTGLGGLLVGSALALASACGGLDSVKIVITDDAGSGGNPSGGSGASGNHQGGGKSNGGDTFSDGGVAGTADFAGAGGTAGEEASGGEGGEIIVVPPDPMPGPPTVVSVSPRDQSVGADPTGTIRVSFSEPLDPATVTGDSVQIKDGAGALVGGTVTYADAIATFKPKGRLNLLGNYTVSVTTAVTDAGKTPMERPFASSFSVKDGQWGKTESSLTGNTGAFDRSFPLVLATDGVGRAVAAWIQVADGGSNPDVYAALFAQGKGWATPVKVNINGLPCTFPSVSMNASGNLIVGWVEKDASITTQPYSVQARRNIANTWDASSTRIDIVSTSTLTVNPENVAVAISANGHAHVAWYAFDYNATVTPTVNDYGVFARHADERGNWDAAVSSLTLLQVSSGASGPALAFDAAGNGFAAYQFTNNASPAKTNTLVSRYLATTNKWGTSALASTPADGSALPVSVAMNPTGEAVLAYERITAIDASNNSYALMGSYFNKAWSAPAVISSAITSIASTRWLLASSTWTGSSFLVAWAQSGGSTSNIYANEYKAAWGTATIISDGNHSSSLPWLTGDTRGNALAVWYQQSDTASTSSLAPIDIVFSRFTGATDKWSNFGRVSSAIAGYRYPQAVTLGDGTALAGWQRTINNVGNIKLLAVNGVFENDFQ